MSVFLNSHGENSEAQPNENASMHEEDFLSDDDFHDHENYPRLEKRKSIYAFASLSCGLIASLICCLSFGIDFFAPAVGFISGFLQISVANAGIILFIVDLIKNKKPNGMSHAGLIASVFSIIIASFQILYASIATIIFIVSVLVHVF